MKPSIVVVGSCMTDLTSYTQEFPKPGETICGTSFIIGFGGKGANQCIAAARLGAKTAMVARVGNDSFGENYIKNFKNNKVNGEHVHAVEGVSTGVATIVVNGKVHDAIRVGIDISLDGECDKTLYGLEPEIFYSGFDTFTKLLKSDLKFIFLRVYLTDYHV